MLKKQSTNKMPPNPLYRTRNLVSKKSGIRPVRH